jgi:hypothetical protein
MYIVAIAWIYITLLMAFTEASITAGVLTFLFYGLFPCALFIWIMGTPQRRRNRLHEESLANGQGESAQISLENELDQPDGADTQRD